MSNEFKTTEDFLNAILKYWEEFADADPKVMDDLVKIVRERDRIRDVEVQNVTYLGIIGRIQRMIMPIPEPQAPPLDYKAIGEGGAPIQNIT